MGGGEVHGSGVGVRGVSDGYQRVPSFLGGTPTQLPPPLRTHTGHDGIRVLTLALF